MIYKLIELRQSFPWWPGWSPGFGASRDRFKYEAPEYEIKRAPGDAAYQLRHAETGECAEVPMANVRGAVRQVEAAAEVESA